MRVVIFAIVAYLYGSVPFAYISTFLFKKRNLAKEGTGNIGVTNAFKVGGYAVGIITVCGEISKAILPILATKFFFSSNLHITLLFLYLAFLGTCFSVFLKGKGGKGSTVALWGLFILSPYACVILLLLWTIVVLISNNNPNIKSIPLLFIPIIFHLAEKDFYFTIYCILLSVTIFINNKVRLDDYKYYGNFKKNK